MFAALDPSAGDCPRPGPPAARWAPPERSHPRASSGRAKRFVELLIHGPSPARDIHLAMSEVATTEGELDRAEALEAARLRE